MLPAWLLIALSGGFGGSAPNIFRVGTGLLGGERLPEFTYVLGVLLFFFMGACVALAFQESDVKKAFFLGLSLPAMFQSGVHDISESQVASLLVPAVMAAEEPPRSVLISYNAEAPDFSLIFSAPERGRVEVLIEGRETREKDDGEAVVQVPRWAESFNVLVLADRQMSEASYVLSEDEWVVSIEQAALLGLKQSIGVKNADRWKITIGRREGKK